MSGINRIQQKMENFRDGKFGGPSRSDKPEIWFKDGDQVFVTSAATGDENDTLLDEIYLYTFEHNGRWVNVLKDDRVDTSNIPEKDAQGKEIRPSHKFVFWGYVHHVIHSEKKQDDWEEIAGPGGRKLFKETVNDFKVIPMAFGRGDYVWNQLVDAYSDWGSLSKGVLKIKRTGTGQFDTSYTITATPKKDEIPEDRLKEVAGLKPIKDYYFETYGEKFEIQESSSGGNDSLF